MTHKNYSSIDGKEVGGKANEMLCKLRTKVIDKFLQKTEK